MKRFKSWAAALGALLACSALAMGQMGSSQSQNSSPSAPTCGKPVIKEYLKNILALALRTNNAPANCREQMSRPMFAGPHGMAWNEYSNEVENGTVPCVKYGETPRVIVDNCVNEWVSDSNNADGVKAFEDLCAAPGPKKLLAKAKEYAAAHFTDAKGNRGIPQGLPPAHELADSSNEMPLTNCAWDEGILQFLSEQARQETPSSAQSAAAQQQAAAKGKNIQKSVERQTRGWNKSPEGGIDVGGAGGNQKSGSSSSVQTQASLDSADLNISSLDSNDLYLNGAVLENICWPASEGGGCRKLALKIVSTTNAQGGAQLNYVDIVDYTDPNNIFQRIFALAPGSQDFYLDSRDPQHMKYHFNLGINADGGMTLSRVDAKSSKERGGFLGKIAGMFDNLFHETTATPVAYTSAAELYVKRNDEILNKPAAEVVLNGQSFNVIGQGGPQGCLLFFAVSPGGQSLMQGPDGELGGEKPNLMACVNSNAGDGTQQMTSGPHCLGTFKRGNTAKSYSIKWMPQESQVGNNFRINEIPANSGVCAVPDVAGSSTTAQGSPGSGPTSGGGQSGGGQKGGGSNGQSSCGYTGIGDKIGGLGDTGYEIYSERATSSKKEPLDSYASYLCKDKGLLWVPGLVYKTGGAQGEMNIDMISPQYNAEVSSGDLGQLSASAIAPHSDGKTGSDFALTVGGASLEIANLYDSGRMIYHVPAGAFKAGAIASQSTLGHEADAVSVVEPDNADIVVELIVFPRGGVGAVDRAVDLYLGTVDSNRVAALKGGLKSLLSKVPLNAKTHVDLNVLSSMANKSIKNCQWAEEVSESSNVLLEPGKAQPESGDVLYYQVDRDGNLSLQSAKTCSAQAR
ncbi:MAG: hypothetical protein ACYCPQ_01540 [Elusimicrobiota bacterium]